MKNVIRKKQKIPGLILLLLYCCCGAMAQNSITVSGIVMDEFNDPVIGATVIVKGENSIGITTNIDGEFSLTVPGENSVLVVSYIGMLPQGIK